MAGCHGPIAADSAGVAYRLDAADAAGGEGVSVRVTNAQLATAGKSRSKYRNQRTSCGMHEHDSRREAIRCGELQLLEKAHVISGLRTQQKIPLEVNGKLICNYVADWIYMRDGKLIVEDAKGMKTAVYRLKKKLVAAVTGLEIVET